MEQDDYRNLKTFTRLIGFILLLIVSLFSTRSFSTGNWTTENGYGLIAIIACGSIYGLIERTQHQRQPGERSVFYVVYNDLRITNFSTTGIISAVYSILYGAVIGVSIFGIALSVQSFNLMGASFALMVLLASLLTLLLLLPIRVAAESYVVVFKVAQKYLNGDKN